MSQPSTGLTETYSQSAMTRTMPMELVYPKRSQIEKAKPAEPKPEIFESNRPMSAPKSEAHGISNVVQRAVENPVQQLASGAKKLAGGSSSRSSASKGTDNLEKIAEDVLPYLKRLFEIEAERLSGLFR